MKNLLLVGLMLVSTLSFAHDRTREEKQKMYNTIQEQLDEGMIDIQTAQKMWSAYIKCCKTEKKGDE
jgi:outer membrane protease